MLVRLRNVLIVLTLLFALGVAGAALFVYAGIYNVSALKQHTSLVYKVLNYALVRSVKEHSEDVAVPDLSSKERVLSGLAHYRGHCLQCHGAPGVSPAPFAIGLKPMPANLATTARHWKPAEIFWVVKHGIKMSGMPAWEYRLTDDEIWDVVAFVEQMVSMAPIEYAQLEKAASPHQQHHHDVDHAKLLPAGSTKETILGDVTAGRRATANYLCATCHHIPGIVGGDPVGPPLDGIGSRKFIGGVILNTPENMVRWIQNPQQFDPLSAMPNMNISEEDARDIAAYLYTLDTVK